MIDNINKIVVDSIQAATRRPIVKSNTVGKRPEYPFLTFTITSPSIPRGGTYGDYGSEYRRSAKQVWSISALSDKDNEAMTLAMAAADWLEQGGRLYLADRGVIVQLVGGISNRDTLIEDNYEYRYGFDATFTVENIIKKTAEESAEVIESAEVPRKENINGE